MARGRSASGRVRPASHALAVPNIVHQRKTNTPGGSESVSTAHLPQILHCVHRGTAFFRAQAPAPATHVPDSARSLAYHQSCLRLRRALGVALVSMIWRVCSISATSCFSSGRTRRYSLARTLLGSPSKATPSNAPIKTETAAPWHRLVGKKRVPFYWLNLPSSHVGQQPN